VTSNSDKKGLRYAPMVFYRTRSCNVIKCSNLDELIDKKENPLKRNKIGYKNNESKWLTSTQALGIEEEILL